MERLRLFTAEEFILYKNDLRIVQNNFAPIIQESFLLEKITYLFCVAHPRHKKNFKKYIFLENCLYNLNEIYKFQPIF